MLVANQLALKELTDALSALDIPHDKLPEVKDKDGVVITDPKEKRLALVRLHVQAAGNIINLVDKSEQALQMSIVQTLQQQYKPQLDELVGQKLQALTNGANPPENCDCAECEERRKRENAENPASEVGFGIAAKRLLEQKK